ncbi:hypothetical protein OG749_36200 [Streptomyces nojiriensis]|uniref:hypothetical protein n=1 Tax=Streptomyces nojiriensis TaxID=66374 RepID=UPI002E18CF31
MPEAAWPAGVIARYLTKAAEILGEDITVNVFETKDGHQAHCRGCRCNSFDYTPEYVLTVVDGRACARPTDLQACDWAQAHAETCRAMPRPMEV